MADGNAVVTGFADGELRLLAVRELRLLSDDKIVTLQLRGREEVHVEGLLAVVGIDEVSVLGVVLHACAHAAPHAGVGL